MMMMMMQQLVSVCVRRGMQRQFAAQLSLLRVNIHNIYCPAAEKDLHAFRCILTIRISIYLRAQFKHIRTSSYQRALRLWQIFNCDFL